jgi:1-acyl-sn-glycerol-3-phosphate acyltransferase
MRRLIARLWLKLWRIKSVPRTEPFPQRCVIVAAPHTSNWDFPLVLALATAAGIKIHWLGKAELFKGPMGTVMRKLGGVSVNRSSAGSMVGEMVTQLNNSEVLRLVVPAEGTRSKSEYWKSGFYRIAVQAEVPIVFGYVDRVRGTGGFPCAFAPSGDINADMEQIRAFYAGMEGLRRGKTSVPRLREEHVSDV